MWRQRATCALCSTVSSWNRDPEKSARQIRRHLLEVHGIEDPRPAADYQVVQERQCDYCLGSYMDDCTKCRRDFCKLHAGDIDGLCGGCI